MLARCLYQIPCRNTWTFRSDQQTRIATEWFRAWWPALLWAGMITFASTDTFSSANTSSVVVPIVRWVDPAVSSEHLEAVHLFVRKSAHFAEYFIFYISALTGSCLRSRSRSTLRQCLRPYGPTRLPNSVARLSRPPSAFVREFNNERPHEALAMKTPAEAYSASATTYRGLPNLTYPLHDRDVLVTACGRIFMHRKRINISHAWRVSASASRKSTKAFGS